MLGRTYIWKKKVVVVVVDDDVFCLFFVLGGEGGKEQQKVFLAQRYKTMERIANLMKSIFPSHHFLNFPPR